ncbi:hypothetical protein AKJ09_10866 [Labilithrix luteola]|uniref:Uncharacterized protein n=1 Tax=Labilithrix luteola TaxID=1391654 RepID=A0A0K1QER1_9BACT|nr:hypothetical protein [Labilithrix luteola]AKV04203.1 hypothetical protein AKJ09_10866 [Labilithrix luteola]
MKANLLTQYSAHANTIADTYRAAFRETKVGDYTVEMTAPEGSTKGGLLALQHLTLRPPSGMSLVVGVIHAGDKRADVRSYESVKAMHEERFKRPLPFDAAAYAAFAEKSRAILSAFGLAVTVVEAPKAAAVHPRAEDAADESGMRRIASSGNGRTIAIVAAAVVGLAVLALLARAIWNLSQ